MNISFVSRLSLCVAALSLMSIAYAQGNTAPIPQTLTTSERQQAIKGVLRLLREKYVFSDVAQKMETAIRERQNKKTYNAIQDGNKLAYQLTQDLQSVSHDQHLQVHYSPDILPPFPDNPMEPKPEVLAGARKQTQQENFGFEKAEILRGNIGYLKINYFVSPKWMGETCAAVMNYLAHTDALIIDLRTNPGSMDPDAVPFFCSYFFSQPTHINSLYWRLTDKTTDYYTLPSVPGNHYGNKPIYLLTSNQTFSGAEEFAYDLKNLKRATIIGEITGGGANAGGDLRASDHFVIWVPVGRAINPVSKTNWEGVGVQPDVAVPANRALYTAHLAALSQLLSTATPEQKNSLRNARTELRDNPPLLANTTFTLSGFAAAKTVTVAGTFNGWNDRATPLKRSGKAWTATLEMEPGKHQYKFIVDGKWMIDPANTKTQGEGEYKNSVRIVR